MRAPRHLQLAIFFNIGRGGSTMVTKKIPAAASALTLVALAAVAGDRDHHGDGNRPIRVSATLISLEEVPVVSSAAARGRFKATIDTLNQTISYELSYEGLEAAPTQAHIHIGQRRVNGGISLFLCGNPPNVPPAPVPAPPPCPAAPATITGELTAANIAGPVGQGIELTAGTTNAFAEIVEMVLDGFTYANVHSAKFPAGEVRGQVRVDKRRHW
jgi:CHRD domain